MSQRISGEPQGSVPQGVADDIAALASDIRAIERRAAAAWKTALVIWIILLAVIFSYLYFAVYAALKGYAQEFQKPDTLVGYGMSTINNALEGQGLPALDSPGLPTKLAGILKDQAPKLFREQIRPQVQDLLDQLPEKRRELAARIRQEAPVLIEQGLGLLETELLPTLREEAVKWADAKTDELLAVADQTLKDAVDQVVATHEANIRDIQDEKVLRKALELAFEDAMGDVMDELFVGLDESVAEVRVGMEDLVYTYTTKPEALTKEQRLEIRLVQLVEALFRGAALEMPTGEGILQELEQLLDELAQIGEVPEEARQEIRQAVPAGREPDLSRVPEEYREQVRSRIQSIRRGPPAGARPAAPTPAGPVMGPPPEARERMEEARRRGEARREEAQERAEPAPEKAEPAPGLPAVRRGPPPEVQARIEEAKRRQAEAAAKAGEAAPAGQ